MKKLTKKLLSLMLTFVMVATIIPLGAFVAEAAVSWTAVASSDFSKATIGTATQWSGDGNKYDATVTAPAYVSGTNTINWVSRVYQPTNYSYAVLDDYDDNGTNDALYMDNGYMYMNMNEDGHATTPFENASRFKIDFSFRYKSDYNITSDGTYTFMKLGTFGNDNNYIPDQSPTQTRNSIFVQDANGMMFSYDTKYADGAQAKRIATSGDSISKNTSYHYIVEYTGYRFKVFVTDENYNTLFTLLDTTDSTTYKFSDVENGLSCLPWGGHTYFKIGACDEAMYLRYLEYENITFYTGTTYTDNYNSGQPSNNTDKYVMAYFTGNGNLDNESLRYAVSTDGINYHTLNRGNPVTTISNPTGLAVYPTGTTQSANATGHVRDPFILRKQDGSGFFVLATDLDTGANGFNNNSKFLVWEVAHLEDIATATPWVIDIRSMMQPVLGDDNQGNPAWIHRAWAPEAIYDAAKGKYMMHFSVRANNSSVDTGTYLYCVYTSDFKSFDGTPKRLIYTGADNIDASINYNAADDLYYMWYKNESVSKLCYATSTSADGQYINQASFDYSKDTPVNLEGPEVFKNIAGDGWIFLCDAYKQKADPATSKEGVFKAFTASTITGFDKDNPVSTNIPYLYARHAGVTRVTNAEYEALIAAYGGMVSNDKIEYFFTGNTSTYNKYRVSDNGTPDNPDDDTYAAYGWLGSVRDPGEHIFKVSFSDGNMNDYYSASAGVLTLNKANVFMQDDDLRTVLKSSAFTVNFKCKITDSGLLDDSNVPIAAVSNINKDFIRLETDGEFYVNGTTVDSGFYPQENTEYDVSISYNGATASLFVDGEYKTGLVLDVPVTDSTGNNNCYLSLGWSDACGVAKTNKISAQYKELSIVGTAIETGNHDDAVMPSYTAGLSSTISGITKTTAANDATVQPTIGILDTTNTSNHTVVNFNNTTYYQNILYYNDHASDYNVYTWLGKGESSWSSYVHLYYPGVTVLLDSTETANRPIIPVSFGAKIKNGGTFPSMVRITTSDFAMQADYWCGKQEHLNWYSGGNYNWISAQSGYRYGQSKGDDRNYSETWSNAIRYTGTPTSTLTEITSTNWRICSNGSSCSGSYESDTGNYNTTLTPSGENYTIRIIDVRELNALIDTIKSGGVAEINNINNDANYYTASSTRAFIRAIEDIADFDIGDYFATNTKNNYSECSTKIDSLISNYATTKAALTRQYKITYQKDVVGTEYDDEMDHYYLATGTSASKVSELAPSLSEINAAHYHDATNHYTYTWTGAGFANVSSNVTYSTQVASSEAHNHTAAQAHVAAVGDTNGYTDYACSVCDYISEGNRVWDDQSADWTAYNEKASVIATKAADTNYTTDSRSAYQTAANAAVSGVTLNDETKSAEYIEARTTALTNAERKLNHVADYSALNTALTSNATAKANYNSYTYDSWVPFATAYNSGSTINSAEPSVKANTPMYAVDGSGYVDTETYSTEQGNINTAKDSINSTSSSLVAVPVAQYETYESARTVITSALDTKKYTAAGIATITGESGAVTTANNALYHKLTESQASTYSTLTGESFATNALVRNCSSSATVDGKTSDILTASTNLNAAANKATNIRQYDVTLTLKDAEKDIDDIIDYDSDGFTNGVKTYSGNYYGDSLNITLPDGIKNNYSIANWSATNLDVDNGNASTGSQKAASNVGYTLTKIVNSKIAVVVELGKNTLSDNQYRYNICNVYGAVKDVKYGNYDTVEASAPALSVDNKTITINGNVQPVDELPFYDFDGWTVSYNANSRTYTIKPEYTVAAATYVISVTGGTASNNSPKFDEIVTVSSSVENFAAWAVLKDGKYQIASYSANYSFYACTDEAYVAIVSNGSGGYQTSNGVAIEYSNVDGQLQDLGSVTANNNLVNAKIAGKLPFISIQKTDMYDKKEVTGGNLYTKARVYARVTEGSANDNGFGVLFREGAATDSEMVIGYDENTKSRTVTNILSTGQFTYTLNRSRGFEVDVTFRGYVNYNATYTAAGSSSTINALDYSKIGISRYNA